MNSSPRTFPLPKLDRNFVAAVKLIGAGLRSVLKLSALLFDASMHLIGYQKQVKSTTSKASPTEQTLRTTSLDTRSFHSFGSLRWVHDHSLEETVESNRIECEEEVLRFSYRLDDKDRTAEVRLFGELQDHELLILRECLVSLYERMKIDWDPIRVIDFVPSLGRFLSAEGAAASKVPGFNTSAQRAVLALEEITFEPALCHHFFKAVLEDSMNQSRCHSQARLALWNHHDDITKRIAHSRDYGPPSSRAPFGTLRARRIIERDAKIAGGVSLGWPVREAIVIDERSSLLQQVAARLISEIRQLKEPLGLCLEERILELVLRTARSLLPRDSEEALRAFRERHRVVADMEISLERFVEEETGNSEHRALLAGYLLETIATQMPEYLRGRPSIDRNWLPGECNTWVRYKHSERDIYIIDPGRNCCVRLDDYRDKRWPYEREEDIRGEKGKRRPIPI